MYRERKEIEFPKEYIDLETTRLTGRPRKDGNMK
jgi:hypothetical protein